MSRAYYEITEESVTTGEETAATYGVRMRTEEGCVVIADVSPDRTYVERIVRSFNENGLEPSHFADAVEDSLAAF